MSGYYYGTEGDFEVLITSLPLGMGKVMEAQVSDLHMDSRLIALIQVSV